MATAYILLGKILKGRW